MPFQFQSNVFCSIRPPQMVATIILMAVNGCNIPNITVEDISRVALVVPARTTQGEPVFQQLEKYMSGYIGNVFVNKIFFFRLAARIAFIGFISYAD